jgi:hydroxymethylpyrimidine pyrophosphatase-like HAD family hydrolase
MLEEADMSAAPESAMPEVRMHARIITASHTQSAIADLVGKLESLCD